MQHPIHNLQPKCITDFTSGDTIYIRRESKSSQSATLFLCQFIEYKVNKIYGKAIQATVNESLYQSEIDNELILSASLSNCALYGENPETNNTYYHFFMSSGYAIYPGTYKKESENADIIKNHKSFGLIRLSRKNARSSVLFGSSITHNEIISLTITEGEVDRHLNREWYHGRKTLIEVDMSSNQFAEFITSPNQGSGIPCTIKYLNGDAIPEPPYESRKDMFSREFKNEMNNISVDLKENIEIAKKILSKPNVNKGDKEELLNLFQGFVNKIQSTVPFIEKSFVEQMENTVTEAKGEIEAFITRRITEEGRKALLGENKDLLID